MDRTALVSLGNQVVVIGLDGKLRVLTEGQQPLPGEVVVTSTDVGPLDLNVQLTQEQGSKDVTDDVLQIISAIEQGQDPSAVDEEFAPAAGENGGSSLQTSATIVRDGTELLASTSFETIGIESLGLSQTQVLALNDLFRSNLQTSADSTDKPLATTPVTLDAIEEDGGSIIITTQELLSNVDDEDKDTLSVENLIIDKGNGTLVDNGDGTWTFTPQIDDDTEVSFTFDIIDDEDLVVSASANLDILPINDAPNAENDVITTGEDTAVTIDVLVNDSDVEGDVLSIQSASVPSEQGSVDIVDGKLVFTPAENFHGDAEITYTLTDGALTDQATVNVTVNAVNDTPVVESNLADQTLAEDFTPYTIDLNTAFSDVDNVDGELTFSVSGNSNVLVSIENGIATITPTADWNGSETLTFTATDPSGESVSQTVNFTVVPVADIVADKATVVEDTPTIIKVLGNDTFEDDGKVVSLDTNNGPANGTVSVNPDGSVTYTPNDNYVGKDTFTYVVTSGGVSESTTVEVNVTPVNDAPVAKDDIATTQEDTAVTIDVLPNDTDVDGDKLSIESVSVPKEQGTVEVVDGKLVFTPAENFNGDAEITYTV
ncbi:cadherin-like domain-containing protein, partial [Vibrio parahaemolyticus]|uniref:cadherin-like domain-containing protein n=1 Tax=Vibrio parahaemolyticus TaxID=670 RepID=UPI00211AA442